MEHLKTPRIASRLQGLIAFLVLLLTALALPAQAQERPNVLVLLADDMTYDDLGSYGNEEVHTPNLDRLAQEGVRFEYAFNSSPMCAPTRMSLYTGIHPVRNGAHPNHSRVYSNVQSMPGYLRDLGYRVALVGKRHEAPAENFNWEFLGGRHHDGGKGLDLDLDTVRTFMEESKGQPWALVVSSNQPHGPWTRGNPYMYPPDELTVPPYLVDTPETRRGLSRYYAEITYMDGQMGTVLQHLEKTGQADNTLVIFLSEQGAHFPHSKWTVYDTGVRSAALVRWPGVTEPGRTTEAMMQYVDVMPTLLEAAGGDPVQHDFDGESLVPVLAGERDEHHDYAFSMQTSTGIYNNDAPYGIRSVRSHDYRLIWNLNHENTFSNLVTGGYGPWESWVEEAEAGDPFARQRVRWYQQRPEFELYDVRKDPYELHNLADDPAYREVRDRLKDALDRWMEQQGDQGAATERQALERQSDRWKG